MDPHPNSRLLDGSAMGLSTLCLAHCLALPLVASALPAAGAWAHAPWVHVALIALAAPLAAAALLRRVHGRWPPAALVALGGAGVGLLAWGAFGPARSEVAVTVFGASTLVVAHLWNWRRTRRG
ncbi:MAG: MerC domain-containing protein [Proteobacteria bacterium]|nr:MerC domain-containing protein [Pseudomonadota bacterium]